MLYFWMLWRLLWWTKSVLGVHLKASVLFSPHSAKYNHSESDQSHKYLWLILGKMCLILYQYIQFMCNC